MKLDQLASPETCSSNTLFPYPSHTGGQTEKADRQMTTDATVKAFKRAASVEMSTWYKGILISNLATELDTGGAFEFVVTRMKKGTEPPPHMHEREHEMFYILEGMIDVYVGDECFRAAAGECAFLPKGKRPGALVLPPNGPVNQVSQRPPRASVLLVNLSFCADSQAIALAFRPPVTPNPPFRSQSQSEASHRAAPPPVSAQE
jgi:mannose-6-phosphate isomerase-like protein (cupin superfamily)